MSVLFVVWKILIVNLTVTIAVYKVRNITIRNWILNSSHYVPATPTTKLNITGQYSIIAAHTLNNNNKQQQHKLYYQIKVNLIYNIIY